MGVEPTWERLARPPNGFEDRAPHQRRRTPGVVLQLSSESSNLYAG
jgi:hypothetical protein